MQLCARACDRAAVGAGDDGDPWNARQIAEPPVGVATAVDKVAHARAACTRSTKPSEVEGARVGDDKSTWLNEQWHGDRKSVRVGQVALLPAVGSLEACA